MDTGSNSSGFTCANGVAIATEAGISLDINADETHQQAKQNDVWNTKRRTGNPVEHWTISCADTNAARFGKIKRHT